MLAETTSTLPRHQTKATKDVLDLCTLSSRRIRKQISNGEFAIVSAANTLTRKFCTSTLFSRFAISRGKSIYCFCRLKIFHLLLVHKLFFSKHIYVNPKGHFIINTVSGKPLIPAISLCCIIPAQ